MGSISHAIARQFGGSSGLVFRGRVFCLRSSMNQPGDPFRLGLLELFARPSPPGQSGVGPSVLTVCQYDIVNYFYQTDPDLSIKDGLFAPSHRGNVASCRALRPKWDA